MKPPHTERTRQRMIRELVEHETPDEAKAAAAQWEVALDEELDDALAYNRERKLSALAQAITESEMSRA